VPYEHEQIHGQETHKKPRVPMTPDGAVEHDEEQAADEHEDVLPGPPRRDERQAREEHEHEGEARDREGEEVPVDGRAHEGDHARVLQGHDGPEVEVPHLHLLQGLGRVVHLGVQGHLARRQGEQGRDRGGQDVQHGGAEVLDLDLHVLGVADVAHVGRVHGEQRVAVVRGQGQHHGQLHQREAARRLHQRVVVVASRHGWAGRGVLLFVLPIWAHVKRICLISSSIKARAHARAPRCI
jgi:hypothetical protein